MANIVTIRGAQVDADDPCALWQALYAFKLAVLAGERVEEIEVRSPVTTRRSRFGASSMSDLEAELDRLQASCEAKSGRRRRYAIRGTYRPY
ncbi:hypothetical protein GCM10007301_15420 [Azorhizobium oxalatiphilum]|uniref:Uncharacterized protein n=1 Tax=Azorhizobium oxalatiphilum TaxID=980631 RepID=A0A917BS29_9HYPH|nr:hypothetical protein [Azorhizobium oxalatiphilum]GGF56651.1 hypothetical protein GCM10007301_15420 [Azorhizobium oxalatiphilum]